jgi:uncharacterized repeat protein (TIGR03806 family)
MMCAIPRAIASLPLIAVLTACGGSSSGGGQIVAPPPPPLFGLDQRPSNLTCLAPDVSAQTGADIDLAPVFANLSFSQPLAMLQAPGDSSRWFVLEKTGRVRVFANTPNVAAFSNDFIDIGASFDLNDDSEGGLLGMAFHPQFATNREVFLSWTEGSPMVSVVARFTSLDGGQTLDPGSREDIIRVNQDFTNHNGGQIGFGPDGFLYIGFGDGGSGGDPNSRAQDTRNLLGAVLRIDIDGGSPYAIPAANPFFGNAACPANHSSAQNCPEIYAWGLRNPWRWSFDAATGDLWVGDVGQGVREEIDRVELGGNYGWDCREGMTAFASPAASCASAMNLIEPVHDYPRSLGSSVTGGYVYRGNALPALVGDYLFADYGSGRIWRLAGDGSGGFISDELLDTNLSIASFGIDNTGELYVVDIALGGLYRIVDGGAAPNPASVAAMLSATGCVDPQNPALPASGLIPYDVAAPFWSDGADKERWLAIPNGTTITVQGNGDFSFPIGSVLIKHFRIGGNLVETRLFMRHASGDWAGYSYEWNGADAMLVQGGKVVQIGAQDWIFPSGNDCLTCHTAAAGFALGLETAQLNHDFTYPSTGRTANQLSTLDDIALFATPLANAGAQPRLADPSDAAEAPTARARAYLHTNCAQCHRSGGPTPSSMDLRFDTLLANTLTCDVPPQSGDLGIGQAARIIAPGDPDTSVLVARMDRRDANAMPPLASNVVDDAGVALIRDWIAGLAGCQ